MLGEPQPPNPLKGGANKRLANQILLIKSYPFRGRRGALPLHRPIHLHLYIAFLHGFALVEGLFTLCQAYLQFGEAAFADEERQRYYGQSLFFAPGKQFFEFLFIEQQYTVAFGLVVVE